MTSTNDTMLNAALGYLLQEKRPIPVRHKRARVEWAEFQDRPPTEAEVREWWNHWPDADIALVTGNGWAALDFVGDDGQSAIMERLRDMQTAEGLH